MLELRRVLSDSGTAIVYEDIRARVVGSAGLLDTTSWRWRTGPCTFRNESEWREELNRAGFEVVREKGLSALA